VDHAWVRVIEERPVSLHLAERLGVRHQSPQALLIRNGAAVWNASHHAITASALQNAAARAAQP
jgi:bacillithiol system protein YtxJ